MTNLSTKEPVSTPIKKPLLTIFGAGCFGTALAVTFEKIGFSCCLWGRDPVLIEALKHHRENKKYLPGIRLPQSLSLSTHKDFAAHYAQHWIIAVKAQAVVALVKTLPVTDTTKLILASKGFDMQKLLHHALLEHITYIAPEQIYALSGPSFARELAQEKHTALILAGHASSTLAASMTHSFLSVRPSNDVTGVLFSGAFKNVLAIGAGMIEGAKLGENARAAFVCHGFYEMYRLAEKLGASTHTLFGLSGLGDLSMTAMSPTQSRNKVFGAYLGQGCTKEAALAKIGSTVEGIATIDSVCSLGNHYDVPLPITRSIADIVNAPHKLCAVFDTLFSHFLPQHM